MKNIFVMSLLLTLTPFCSQAMPQTSVSCSILNQRLLHVVKVKDGDLLRSGLGSGAVDFSTIADADGVRANLGEELDQADHLLENGNASSDAKDVTLQSQSKTLTAVLKLISGQVVKEDQKSEGCSLENSRVSQYLYTLQMKNAGLANAIFAKTIQVQCEKKGFSVSVEEACR